MACWTVIGKGTSGDVVGKAFGVTLDTDNESWIANGASVDLFFTSGIRFCPTISIAAVISRSA